MKINKLPTVVNDNGDGQTLVKPSEASIDAFSNRMKLLTHEFRADGGMAEIARRCGFSEGVVRSWREGRSDPSRARCVQLAAGTGASLLWLVSGDGPMWQKDVDAETSAKQVVSVDSQPVRSEDLIISMELADEALDGRVLPRHKYAKLVALICDAIVNGLPEAQVLKFARPAAKGLDD